jgi:hypothetical protein
MKPFLIIFLTIIVFLATKNSYSQNTINLLDGKQITASKIYEDTSNMMLRYDIRKDSVNKKRSVDRLEIYSIVYPDKTEKIFYRQDSAIGYPMSIKQMSNFILGEREARKYYKAPLVTIGGILLGGVAANYIQFWSLLEPVAYGTGIAIFGPRIKTSKNISADLVADKHFIRGYREYATKKKVKNAILGSAVGIVLLGIASEIINTNW